MHRPGEPGGWKRRKAHHETRDLLPPYPPPPYILEMYQVCTPLDSIHSIKSQTGWQKIPEKLQGTKGRFWVQLTKHLGQLQLPQFPVLGQVSIPIWSVGPQLLRQPSHRSINRQYSNTCLELGHRLYLRQLKIAWEKYKQTVCLKK